MVFEATASKTAVLLFEFVDLASYAIRLFLRECACSANCVICAFLFTSFPEPRSKVSTLLDRRNGLGSVSRVLALPELSLNLSLLADALCCATFLAMCPNVLSQIEARWWYAKCKTGTLVNVAALAEAAAMSASETCGDK